MQELITRFRYGAAVVLATLFFASWGGQLYFEAQVYADESRQHHEQSMVWTEALHEADFWEEFGQSTLENWQSEFLQVLAAAWVFKRFLWKGSPESKE
jgi:hypothetical protein